MKRLKINPVLIKEMSQIVRNPKFPIAIGVYLALISLLGVATLTGIFSGAENFRSLKNSFIILYKMLLGFAFALLIFMIPVITASSISSEKEGKTLDILLATTIGTYKIVTGKLFSAITRIMLYAFASLPVIGLVFVVGVIDLNSIGQFFVVLFVTSFLIGSFGVLMSVIFTRTATATIVTYSGMLLVLAGTVFAVLLDDVFLGNRIHLDIFDIFLLFNPIATVYVMMTSQLGTIGEGLQFIITENRGENFVITHWLTISLILQSLVGIVNVFLSGYLLDPLRKR